MDAPRGTIETRLRDAAEGDTISTSAAARVVATWLIDWRDYFAATVRRKDGSVVEGRASAVELLDALLAHDTLAGSSADLRAAQTSTHDTSR